ncbi:hypothetical protein TVAG_276940 [Trichomonas vaginalis G3]|uniref:Uncharacterized protein n=1 Tax=Trichomonas vaginalis (strain ATCC PRA-98 / G3) TaxID=412133 RepID=A2FUF4_TRIV3|nr:hypothetical protein TVAGG3_0883790 [Trichomonas vaginalis G3]EAX91475.1 hypothetical protein TVAG_276940 [Trichomonas vaginalis G3]KAI5502236.1 hypothetical protein TVAGG3_0883790 [Trichomonas vaginalis G3]|eukprot:XP_001304405.1 hypothetical protein [Trichomonas vaginalis G3]
MSIAIREFLVFNTSSIMFKDFSEKFAVLTNMFQDYCNQTASALGMVNKTLQIPSILVNTSKNLQKIIAELFSSYESIKNAGSTVLFDVAKSDFKKLQNIVNVIEKSISDEHFYDDSVVNGLPKIKKTLKNIHEKAFSILNEKTSEEEVKKFNERVKVYIRDFTSFIDKDLPPSVFQKNKKIKMRSEVTSYLGNISSTINSFSRYPFLLEQVGETIKVFTTHIDETNKTMNIY